MPHFLKICHVVVIDHRWLLLPVSDLWQGTLSWRGTSVIRVGVLDLQGQMVCVNWLLHECQDLGFLIRVTPCSEMSKNVSVSKH